MSNCSTISSEGLLQHLRRAIGDAEMRTDPSPHLVLDPAFPPDFYEFLRTNLPGDELYAGWGAQAREGVAYRPHYHQRKQLYIHNRAALMKKPFQSDKQRAFWLDFQTVFMSREMQDIILSRFEPELLARFGGVRPVEGEIITNGMVNFHEPGYFIGPHPDSPDRVATAIFYLAEPGAPEGIGTKFYRPKDPSFETIYHGRFENFDLVSSVPFRANTALVFLRTPNSYHGVEPLTAEHLAGTRRFVLQYMLVHKH